MLGNELRVGAARPVAGHLDLGLAAVACLLILSEVVIHLGIARTFGQRVGFATLRVFSENRNPPCCKAAAAVPLRVQGYNCLCLMHKPNQADYKGFGQSRVV